MITVVIGTNRRENGAANFARQYMRELQALQEEEVKLLDLSVIPHDWFHPDMYEKKDQSESLRKLQDEYILDADRFVFVVPEYNGGFPGALKAFIDGVSVRKYRESFKGKKALLVGVATGRAGNLRGMDHLTGVLHHVGTIVMPAKEPYSRIDKLVDGDGEITDQPTLERIRKHVKEFVMF